MESEETNPNIFDNELDFEEEVRDENEVLENLGLESIITAENASDGGLENLEPDPEVGEEGEEISEPVADELKSVENGNANGEEAPKSDNESESDGEVCFRWISLSKNKFACIRSCLTVMKRMMLQ